MNPEKMDEAQKKAMLLLDGVGDGFTQTQLFVEKKNCHAYTFDDVIIMPGFIDFDAADVNLGSKISRNIKVNVPLLSSPMDTVTEHNMAIGMALQGAIGVVHYNMTVEEQANEVRLVKKYKNGFITNPACLAPDDKISDVDELKAQYGYSGIPITVDGKMGSKLMGIVTNRDVDYIADRSTSLKEVMVTDLVTAPEGVSLTEANEILRKSRKGKLPVVNTSGEIVALISRTGTYTEPDFPNTCYALVLVRNR
jgi:IMP dehydrogenase